MMVTRSVIAGSRGGGPPRRGPPRGGCLAGAGTPAAAHLRRRAPLGQRRVVTAVAGIDLLLPAAPLLHAAAHGAVALGQLLGHEPRPAARTGLAQRPVPGHELARGIAAAAVEELAAPRAALHQLALAAAEQAPHARGHGLVEGLHVLALGIARAAEELPVAAAPCRCASAATGSSRSEEHTSELQSLRQLVCHLLLEKIKQQLIVIAY